MAVSGKQVTTVFGVVCMLIIWGCKLRGCSGTCLRFGGVSRGCCDGCVSQAGENSVCISSYMLKIVKAPTIETSHSPLL
jgi:hypothetical protein